MKKLILFISLVIITTSACQDVIELDTPTYKTTLVVEGRVTDTLGTSVRLSTTANYFAQGETPIINSAIVTLYENDNPVSLLTQSETEPGMYYSSFNGTIGNTYYLQVEVNADNNSGIQNTIWHTNKQELHRVFEFDSLKIKYLDRTTNPPSFNAGQFVLGYFTEPAGVGDFYRLHYWKNDSFVTQTIDILTDEFYDGFTFGKDPVPPITVYGAIDEVMDSITVEVSSISEDYYNYLSLISEQIFQVGGPFASPPAFVEGNVYNANNPEEVGFGYFEASSISYSHIIFRP